MEPNDIWGQATQWCGDVTLPCITWQKKGRVHLTSSPTSGMVPFQSQMDAREVGWVGPNLWHCLFKQWALCTDLPPRVQKHLDYHGSATPSPACPLGTPCGLLPGSLPQPPSSYSNAIGEPIQFETTTVYVEQHRCLAQTFLWRQQSDSLRDHHMGGGTHTGQSEGSSQAWLVCSNLHSAFS